MKSNIGILIAALAFVVVGCAKDQTLDEYHQNEVNDNLTRMNGVAGKYTGTLTNQTTQASMGTIEIDLGATLVPVNNADNTQMTTEAALTGTVIVNSNYLQGSAQISNLAFGGLDSSKSGPISGKINVPLSNGTTVVLAISGTINNGTISGLINSDGTSATVVQTGQFTASLNGPQAGTQGLASGTNSNQNLQHNYTGVLSEAIDTPTTNVKTGKSTPATQRKVGVVMTTRMVSATSAEWLFDNFAQQLNMVVTLVFLDTDPNTGETVTDNQVTFNSVAVDVLSGSFSATGSFAGNVNTGVSLNCSQGQGKYNASAKWNCTFYSALNGAGEPFTAVAQN